MSLLEEVNAAIAQRDALLAQASDLVDQANAIGQQLRDAGLASVRTVRLDQRKPRKDIGGTHAKRGTGEVEPVEVEDADTVLGG